MIQVDTVTIDTNVLQVLYRLRQESLMRGDSYFKDIKEMGDSALITCPMHKNHNENHPSCIISLEDGDRFEAGRWHCFTCNSNGDIVDLISISLGLSRQKSVEWLTNTFGNVIVYDEIPLLPGLDDTTRKEENYLDSSVLNNYHIYHQYLSKRKIPMSIAERFNVGYDSTEDMITFPCWDYNDNLVAINKRSVSGKRFKLQGNANKEIYLLNYIKNDMLNGANYPFVVVCESQINALYAWSLGYPAIALLGTGSKYQYDILNKYKPSNAYVLCFDGDFAGESGANRFIHNVKDVLVTNIELPKDKDLNDLSESEVVEMFRKNGIKWRIKNNE